MPLFTKPQVIMVKGEPAFAVIPWGEYKYLIKQQAKSDEAIVWSPDEVVKANARGESLIKAWRKHLGLTQEELAAKAGMKQPVLDQLEKPDADPESSALQKLADAMEIMLEQLVD